MNRVYYWIAIAIAALGGAFYLAALVFLLFAMGGAHGIA
jgi:hypothetical protein